MGLEPCTQKSNNLFRQRLDELLNPRHPLVQLSQHIDWSVFEDEWSGFFPSYRGRPASSPRLVAGLLYLQHTFALSDEEVVWRWVWQLFCGETWFQHQPPIDPSSLTRWRQQLVQLMAEAGMTLRKNYNRVASKLAGATLALGNIIACVAT